MQQEGSNLLREVKEEEKFVFWDVSGRIFPHLLYEYFASIGIGNYFPDDTDLKNSEPIIVKIDGNIVSPVNVGYLLNITKNYILEFTSEKGESGPILDSLHNKVSLFGYKNLKLLPTLSLKFICYKPDFGFFYFRTGILKVTKVEYLNF